MTESDPTRAMVPKVNTASPLQFIINAAAGSKGANEKREAIESALQAAGRQGELLFCDAPDLPRMASEAAAKAKASGTAVVAVGGDGTINTVAQAAHAARCPMGVVPQGTFNYFARTHGIPADAAQAAQQLLGWTPQPVQVAAVNDRVFLVNASLGLYPDLLEDREAFKARFGRSRLVALIAGGLTLLRAQRRLDLHIELGASANDVRALTLFIGNNRLQLQQLGVGPEPSLDTGAMDGRITAVMLRPIGTLAMIMLMLRGAMGTLGEAQSVERFEFERMVVKTARLPPGRRGVKVAFDGEVTRLRPPLDFRVLDQPLYLLRPNLRSGPVEGSGAPG